MNAGANAQGGGGGTSTGFSHNKKTGGIDLWEVSCVFLLLFRYIYIHIEGAQQAVLAAIA